jgi:pyridoxine 5'-phosphate synthase PdxJ
MIGHISPEHRQEITVEGGITFSFGLETLIDVYDEDDELLVTLDHADISILHAAIRALVRENLEEEYWSGK